MSKTNKFYGFFQDPEGNLSSKRIAGAVAGVAAITLTLTTFVLALFIEVSDPGTCLALIKYLLIASGVAFGFTSLEKLKFHK